MKEIPFISMLLVLILSSTTLAEGMPECMISDPDESIESIAIDKQISRQELLARLVYAEGLSTGFADNKLIYEAIAWGVMNRVCLGEASQAMRHAYGRGIQGVIFKKGQFNPAVSKRSPFSKAFLCPDHFQRWKMATDAAGKAIRGIDNPFIQTPWEKRHDLSLVVNFYYPQSIQAKGKLAPWEENKSLSFIGDILIDGKTLSAKNIRFYRLNSPPADLIKKKKGLL